MKKGIRFGALVLGFAILAAGAFADSTDGTKTKISIWSQFADPNSTDSGSIAFYQALKETREHFPNVEIDHVGSGGEAYKQKLPVAAAADELPDIFFAWGGGSSEPFIAGKRVMPIGDMAQNDGTLSKLVPGTTTNFMFGGKLYGLPIYITTAQLYVNATLLKKAGAPLPTTWAKLEQAIRDLQRENVIPIALGAKDRWPAMFWDAILDIRMGGVSAMNAALKKTGKFDSPEYIKAAQYFQDLIRIGAFGKNYMGTSNDDAVNLFLSGRAAMLYMGGWVNGQIDAPDSPVRGKVVPMKFPLVPGGKGNIDEWHGGSGETFLINAEVKNKQVVWDVYKYFVEHMSKAAYLAGSGASAWKLGPVDDSKLDPLAAQIGQLTANATGFSYWWDQMLNGNDSESMFSTLMKLVALGESPEKFASDMQRHVEE